MTASCRSFAAPPEVLRLSSGDVHVWKASLDLSAGCVQALATTLSEEERTRTKRFFFDRDRNRFVVCRGVLRRILGRYLCVSPGSLEFRYSAYGKPAISERCGGAALRFNVSHTHGTALYAVTMGREIGIDIERISPDVASDRIAEQVFSRREVTALRALSPGGRVKAFFRCWTRKEAYIKARGEGLSFPLSRFDVSLGPGSNLLLSTPDDSREAPRWSLHELYAGPGHVAAVAVEGRGWRISKYLAEFRQKDIPGTRLA